LSTTQDGLLVQVEATVMSDFPSDRTTIADLLALSRTAGPEAAGALAARLGVRYVVCPRGASGYPQYRWDPRRERLVAVTDHPSGTAPRLTRMSRPRTDPRRVTWVNPVNPKAPAAAPPPASRCGTAAPPWTSS